MNKDKSKQVFEQMNKTGSRKVLARLSKRSYSRVKQFTKHAQALVDNVEVGKKSFPDQNLRTAMRKLIGTVEETLEELVKLADAAGDDELVEVVQDAADDLAKVDPDEKAEIEAGEDTHSEETEEAVGAEPKPDVEIEITDDTAGVIDETAGV